jgi:hypothetical protein
VTLDGEEEANDHHEVASAEGVRAKEVPVSPHYAPLEWDHDVDSLDEDDGLAARGDDWSYSIYPVRGKRDQILGYRVSGGDIESGDDLGSTLIDGKSGELTLEKAKSAAQADYASRYREADQFLDDLLGAWEDDDGTQSCRNDQGRIIYRLGETDIDEVEVAVTLRDYADYYDAGSRTATVSLRTVLAYSSNGDPAGLLDFVCQLIRLETQSGGG